MKEKQLLTEDGLLQKAKPVPMPEKNIGIDTENSLYNNIIEASIQSVLDISAIEKFTNVAQTRENIYKAIDTMSRDSTLSSILETYAEDCTQPNDKGQIMWVESSDPNVAKYVTYLLDTLNVDKHLFGWAHSLVKYGDVYLRLYRESDYKDPLFNKDKVDTLNEAVKLKCYDDSDKYAHYIDKEPNPGEMFELTKFGKTVGYIKAPTITTPTTGDIYSGSYTDFMYRMRRRDVEVYQATDYVHATLEDNSSRTPEEVRIFLNDSDYEKDENATVYKVKRGQSLFYNSFRVWRELSLLENSILLNRITKSSIIRLIQIEVGDMGKEEVQRHLRDIKAMIEQKTAINRGQGMDEYTNPGPVENNIYVPTHEGKGEIKTDTIGGDVDVKSLLDLEYFRDKMFSAYRVPKQFFGFVDDAAGFSGGKSLSIISSRYGNSIKRIQNSLIQMMTDAIHLIMINADIPSYINKFTLRMQPPITQEELDRRDNMANHIRVTSDIINTLSNEIDTKSTRLKVIKALVSPMVNDGEIIGLIQDEIDKVEKEEEGDKKEFREEEFDREISPMESGPREEPSFSLGDLEEPEIEREELPPVRDMEMEKETPELAPITPETDIVEEDIKPDESKELLIEAEEEDDYLPSPSELGVDLTVPIKKEDK